MTAQEMQQYLSKFGVNDPVAQAPDGSIVFAGGANAGKSVSTGAWGPVVELDHNTGETLGKNANGKPFAINQSILGTAAKGMLPFVGAGLASNFLNGSSSPASTDSTLPQVDTMSQAGNLPNSPIDPLVSNTGSQGGVNWGSLLGPAIQTTGSLINGAVQQGNTAAQIQNQQEQQALGATQTNPYTQLQDSQRQALANMLVSNYTPQTYTPGHASTGLGDPTTAGSFSGGINSAMQHLSDPSVSQLFGQPAMNAAASNFNKVASNNPFYSNQLAGVPGFNFSAAPGGPSGLGASPTQGVSGTPASSTQPGQQALGAPIPPIPGLSQGPTTPNALSKLSQSLAKPQTDYASQLSGLGGF